MEKMTELKFIRLFEGNLKPITCCPNMDTEALSLLMCIIEDTLKDEDEDEDEQI